MIYPYNMVYLVLSYAPDKQMAAVSNKDIEESPDSSIRAVGNAHQK